MDEIKLLDDFELPRDWNPQSVRYDDYLEALFREYIIAVINLQPATAIGRKIHSLSHLIQDIADTLVYAVRAYLAGIPNQAYQALNQLLVRYKLLLKRFIRQDLPRDKIGSLYRIRASDSPFLTKSEIFHIPFHQRHKVSTQRYSIPGYPCLYFGNSLYVCWEEMNRIDVNKLHIASFSIRKSSNILNFGNRPAEIAALVLEILNRNQSVIKYGGYALCYALLWPLIASCSIRTAVRDASFKVEYIIPQLLMQWLIDPAIDAMFHIDGIRFFSTRVIPYIDNPGINGNFIFPVRDSTTSDFCPVLRNMFEFSEPVSWQACRLVLSSSPPISKATNIPISNGYTVPYDQTEFYLVENQINSMPKTML